MTTLELTITCWCVRERFAGWTPWIRIRDDMGIIAFAPRRQDIDGPVNITAPAPVIGGEEKGR